MDGTRQGQVILQAKEAPVAHPVALVNVALDIHSTPATLGPHVRADQDTIIGHRDQSVDRELKARVGAEKLSDPARDLLVAVARPRLQKLLRR